MKRLCTRNSTRARISSQLAWQALAGAARNTVDRRQAVPGAVPGPGRCPRVRGLITVVLMSVPMIWRSPGRDPRSPRVWSATIRSV